MNENLIFKQTEIARQQTFKKLKDVLESEVQIVPAGFRNNVLWQVGHIYTVQELVAFYFAKEPMNLPEGFKEMFGNGTSPADWTAEPPSLELLTTLLQEQTGRIRATFAGRLEETVPKPFKITADLQLETIGELIVFTLYHEGEHGGFISAIRKAVAAEAKTV